MQESFVHYLWQFQYFDKTNLRTVANEPLQIVAVGQSNTNAGADFEQACLIINGIKWVGNVEMHLRTSDWLVHKHQENQSYDNVVLHVVWENDLPANQPIKRRDNSEIPILTLHNRADRLLVEKYHLLISNQQSKILCASKLIDVKEITKISMLDKALMQRLQRKAETVLLLLKENTGDWETTTYQWTAQSFGFKINNEAFLRLSKGLPLAILMKYSKNLSQLEALLFGQAGLLTAANADAYLDSLQKEYKFLSHKHSLIATQLATHYWRFLRLRPANFPTVRLAQFAQLFYQRPSLFDTFIQSDNVEKLADFFDVIQSDYWQRHYLFGKTAERKIGGLGKESIQNLLINTVAPLLVAYANHKDNQTFIDRAIHFLEQIPPEKNHIISTWENANMKAKNAFDSQAEIELFNNFCLQKRCLHCAIGTSLLRV
jgi:hypothetical protein